MVLVVLDVVLPSLGLGGMHPALTRHRGLKMSDPVPGGGGQDDAESSASDDDSVRSSRAKRSRFHWSKPQDDMLMQVIPIPTCFLLGLLGLLVLF